MSMGATSILIAIVGMKAARWRTPLATDRKKGGELHYSLAKTTTH